MSSSLSWLWIFQLVWNRSSNNSNFWFPVEGGHCCRGGLRQFWNFVTVVIDIGRITVRRQLLKGQESLVCFNCRWRVLTAKLWLICGARLLLFSWGKSKGAVENLFLNCCHHVMAIANLSLNSCHHVTTVFWARVLNSLAAEDACFRMRITLGAVLIRSLVFHVCVPKCCGNGSGMRPYLWVQEKNVWFRQSTQISGLCPVEVLGQFFTDSASYLLRELCDLFLVSFRNGRVSWMAIPRMFLLCFSCNVCQLSFVSQRCHLLMGKCYAVMKTELFFIC